MKDKGDVYTNIFKEMHQIVTCNIFKVVQLKLGSYITRNLDLTYSKETVFPLSIRGFCKDLTSVT